MDIIELIVVPLWMQWYLWGVGVALVVLTALCVRGTPHLNDEDRVVIVFKSIIWPTYVGLIPAWGVMETARVFSKLLFYKVVRFQGGSRTFRRWGG